MRKEQGEISQTSYKKCTTYGKRLMFDSIKIKNFCSSKDSIERENRGYIVGDNICITLIWKKTQSKIHKRNING